MGLMKRINVREILTDLTWEIDCRASVLFLLDTVDIFSDLEDRLEGLIWALLN